MSTQRDALESEEEAVRQVVERVSRSRGRGPVGVSAHSLYKWIMLMKDEKQSAELVEAKTRSYGCVLRFAD